MGVSEEDKIEELAILFGKNCCLNEDKTKACINCFYKAKQVIGFGYSRSNAELVPLDRKKLIETIEICTPFHSEVDLLGIKTLVCRNEVMDIEVLADGIMNRFGQPAAVREDDVNRELVQALEDIAQGMIPVLPPLGDQGVFAQHMWTFSQQRAKQALEDRKKADSSGKGGFDG